MVGTGKRHKDSNTPFSLSIFFPQYTSCNDTKESVFFQSWTFSCSHAFFKMYTVKVQTSEVSSLDLYGKTKSTNKEGLFMLL